MSPQSSDVALSFQDVHFIRNGRRILESVTWTVQSGERWVVLGPNGSGKTTLLRLASTYEVPSRGTLSVLGSRIGATDVRQLRERIGYVSQALAREIPGKTTSFDAVLTGRDATLRRWHQRYTAEDRRRARGWLQALGCDAVHDHCFESLSEGERQRVLIARSLMASPRLLLLDEPVAGLDLGGREHFIARLGAIACSAEVPAIVFVTHHVEEIPEGFTHALLVREGGVVACGALSDTVTSSGLSRCFGLSVSVEHSGGRYRAVAARPTETLN